MPLETSAEQPVPVRTAARLIGDWVARLGRVWVEGQVAQLTSRPGSGTAFTFGAVMAGLAAVGLAVVPVKRARG